MITSSYNPITEIDYNIHSESPFHLLGIFCNLIKTVIESNSTYFSDLDITRSHLLCTLFSTGVEQARDKNRVGVIGGGNSKFTIMLGAVSCSFRKEIKPYQQYEMWTRVLSWDRKWIYLVTHFVLKGAVKPRANTLYPGQKNTKTSRSVGRKEDAIFASALSKMVFKKGRLTISPEIMLEASGLLPPKPRDTPLPWQQPQPVPFTETIASEIRDAPFAAVEKLEALREVAENRLFNETSKSGAGESYGTPAAETPEWTWEKVEEERRRGMELANLLSGLDRLEHEFSADSDALGRHGDLF